MVKGILRPIYILLSQHLKNSYKAFSSLKVPNSYLIQEKAYALKTNCFFLCSSIKGNQEDDSGKIDLPKLEC